MSVARLVGLSQFRNAILLRSMAVWIAIRIGAAFTELIALNVVQSLLVVVAVGAAVSLDARRRDEDLFLANLGISPTAIFLMATLGPSIAELVTQFVV